MMDPSKNYVNDEWVTSETGETTGVTSSANPSKVVAACQHLNENDAAAAVDTAVATEDKWQDTPGPKRGRILREAGALLAQRKGELTEILTAEEGKAQFEAAGEIQRAIDIFHYFSSKVADLGGTKKGANGPNTNLYTRQEPVSIAALITSRDYPIAIPTRKLAPTLAAGNTVVPKPASIVSGIVTGIARALDEAGPPDGILSVIAGPDNSIGSEFIGNEGADLVSFTGDSQAGEVVYGQATGAGRRIQTELGGKNPTLVAGSANPAEAVDIVANDGFGTTGQSCMVCSRTIIHEDVYDNFVAELVDRAESLDVGPGADHGMGPQVSESELSSTLECIDIAKAEGATLAAGGGVSEGETVGTGRSVEPTVFADVDPDIRIAQEEVFGPIVAVIEVSDFDEGLTATSDVDYDLSTGIITDDHTETNRFVDEVEAGVVKVNDETTGLGLRVPFGGFKRFSSKTWREQGDVGFDFYAIEKTVYGSY